jgi:hypothetical protein
MRIDGNTTLDDIMHSDETLDVEVHEDELAHHGIKGQRWGIRRFQRKDGSLTPAGEKRRAKLESEIEKLGGKKSDNASDAKGSGSASGSGKKSVNDMSDEELTKAINRARMEDTYRQLRPEPQPVDKNAFMKQMVNDMVKPALINSGRTFLQNSLSKAGENLLKGKVDPNSLEALKKTYDKLDIQAKINKLKNNPEGDTNWDNMLKKQQYELNKKKIDEANAAEQAARDADARAKQRDMDAYNDFQKSYMDSLNPKPNTTYSNKGGERGQVNPNEERGLSILNNSITNVSKTDVSSGRSATSSHMNDSYSELIDKNGDVILRWGGDD